MTPSKLTDDAFTYGWRHGIRWASLLFRRNGDTHAFDRYTNLATIMETSTGYAPFTVHLSYVFDELIPMDDHIRRYKYKTLKSAQDAVERRLTGLLAVLHIQGRLKDV